MTQEEAATLLGVTGTVTAADVRQRYEEMYNDYQIRLTNAPTSALKKAYQKNLLELQQAAEVLSPGLVWHVPDLPTAEPVPSLNPGNARTVRSSAPEAAKTIRVRTLEGGLPRSTMLAGGLVAVLAALGSLFGVLWWQARQQLGGLETTMRTERTTAEKLQANLASAEWLLKAGPLEVCNRSALSVRITTLVAIYRDTNGKMRTVHSGSYGYPTWDIRPGGRTKLEILRGREDDWDGTVAIYALQVGYPNVEPVLVSGFYGDLKGNCVNLHLD